MNTKYDTRSPPESVAKHTVVQLPDRQVLSGTCVLVVVEGINDVEFLRRISAVLHEHNSNVPDLAAREANGQLVFLPIGGGRITAWSDRLAPISCPELHIYDSEMPPETAFRQQAIGRINARPDCHGVLTRMRSLENYLHPSAILSAGGPKVGFGKDDSVPEVVAESAFCARYPHVPWDTLKRRSQKRLSNRAKRWLNTQAADCMTRQLLQVSDPQGDIVSWLAIIDILAVRRS
jgi:hypothetical protein